MKQSMKKILSVFLAAIMIFGAAAGLGGIDLGEFAFTAEAAEISGVCGPDLTWTFDDETGELTIKGEGDMVITNSWSAVPWASIGSAIKKVTIEYGVTSIAQLAFGVCPNLETISIPETVKSIGQKAFYGCSSMKHITIPENVTSIENSTFAGCSKLIDIKIPDKVTRIGNEAFSGCVNLSEITFGQNSQLKSIGYSAFTSCRTLKDIVLPDSLESIGSYAFYYLYLENITLGKGLKTIYADAFKDSLYIENVYFTGDVADWCNIDFVSTTSNPLFTFCNFYINNELVVDLVIPDGVTKINKYAFYSCINLKSVVVSDSVTHIDESAFANSSIENVTLGNSVSVIDTGAFADCQNLRSIVFPDSVTSIERSAFYCMDNGLQYITFGRGIETIWDSAFGGNHVKHVCYAGSEEEWAEVHIGYGNSFANELDPDRRATMHYNYNPETHVHEYEETITARPNCIRDGEVIKQCWCADRVTVEVPAKGHTPGDWKTERYPTCTEDGEKSKYCTICRVKLETEAIPAKGHVDGEWVYDVQPTCTEDGRGVLHCSKCYEVIREDVVPATGHTPGEWTITTEPTADKEGKKEKFCEVCGEKLEEAVIAKIPVMENLINAPSKTTVNYIDSITLTVDASKIPEGGYVVWNVDNFNFIPVEDGNDLHITSFSSGDTTFTATVYDAEGNAVGTDTQVVNSKAGFFQKIIAFFKILFGLAKAI